MSNEVAEAIEKSLNPEHYGSLVDAIVDSFQRGGDNADLNLVGEVSHLAYRAKQIADAITPVAIGPGKDAAGGHVGSLTEAVMGMTGGLVQIAEAIQELASAVRHSRH